MKILNKLREMANAGFKITIMPHSSCIELMFTREHNHTKYGQMIAIDVGEEAENHVLDLLEQIEEKFERTVLQKT